MGDPLHQMSALALRERIASGHLSPVELMQASIERIRAVDPIVNAVVSTCFDRAEREAQQADSTVRSGLPIGPLHGLPVLIKDLMDTQGLRTTYGSRLHATHVPASDDLIVARLRAAGAIVIGKSNTPEFGAGGNTVNAVFGATRNPHDPALTAGGSSGGSAAALACGMVPLATGSDLGGSLRVPAAFCGVVGFRPTPGLVPHQAHVSAFSTLWTEGPMARSVRDAALMLSAISGHDRRDPLSWPGASCRVQDWPEASVLSRLRVGFSADLGLAEVDDGIAAVFERRKSLLASWFRSACELDIDLSPAERTFKVLRAASFHAAHADSVAHAPELIGENVRNNVCEAQQYTLADVAMADRAQSTLYRSFDECFEQVDVIVCPAVAVSAFPVGDKHPPSINGKPMANYFDWYALTWALSLLACPVVALPCGRDDRGLPFGIQVIGRRQSDAQLLVIADGIETALTARGHAPIWPTLTAPA